MHTQKSPAFVYRPDIDGLRAFAVLAVVLYHAFPTLLGSGFIGVDVFFVISGYLISGIILNDLERGTFTLRNFYRRRIRRIFPALTVVLAAVLLFGRFALFSDEYRALGKHVFGGAAFISNFLLWQEAGYFDPAAHVKPLLHLWSLGIEEQFYIVFPVLLWCCAKKRLRIGTVVIALCILSFLDNLYCMRYPTVNFYSPLTRVWELLAGAALCAAMRAPSATGFRLKPDALAGRVLNALAGRVLYGNKREHDGPGSALALLGLIALACALLLVEAGRPYPGLQALLPVAGTLLLIAAGPSNPVSRHLLGNRFAVLIGLISYPLYLWHWALLSFAFIINGGPDSIAFPPRIGLVAASVALAALTYFLVEKPIRFGVLSRSAKATYALVIGMGMVGISGLAVFLADGLPEREGFKKFAVLTHQKAAPLFVDAAGVAYSGIAKGGLLYCRYTDAGADETVAVIGDSHALSAYWGIAELGRKLRYNTVLLGWIVPAGEMVDTALSAQIPLVLEALRNKQDIRKVFLCARGTVYMTGIRVFPEKVSPAAREEELRKRTGYEPFKTSLQSYVDTLRGYGKEVFIIAENPELPADPRDFIARPFKPRKKSVFPDLHASDVVKRQETYRRLLSEIRGATVIDTISAMCPGDRCLIFTEDGLPMYLDDDHLSFIGSEFQAERILRPHLPGGAPE